MSGELTNYCFCGRFNKEDFDTLQLKAMINYLEYPFDIDEFHDSALEYATILSDVKGVKLKHRNEFVDDIVRREFLDLAKFLCATSLEAKASGREISRLDVGYIWQSKDEWRVSFSDSVRSYDHNIYT